MPPASPQRPRYSRPRTRRDWKFFLRVLIIPILAIAGVATFLYQEHAFRHQQQTTWTTIPATIEDARLHPVARFAFEIGSKDLYSIDVLATYTVNGVPQKEWVTLTLPAQPKSEAATGAATLKGKPCLLRWDPSASDQKIAELP